MLGRFWKPNEDNSQTVNTILHNSNHADVGSKLTELIQLQVLEQPESLPGSSLLLGAAEGMVSPPAKELFVLSYV